MIFAQNFWKIIIRKNNDPLVLEILLYVIDFFDYLLKYVELHDMLNNTVVDTKFEPPTKKNEPPDKKNDPRQKNPPPRKMVDWIKNLLEKTNESIFYKCLTKKIIFLLYL